MFYIFIVIALVLAAFAFTVFFGPPYVRTHKASIQTALDLLEIKEGSRLLDLGSGDGAVLLAGAKRGAKVIGYEINPFLVLIARWRTRSYNEQVKVHWGDMWKAEINDQTQNIYIFMDMRYVEKVDKVIKASGASLKLASYSYEIKGTKPTKTVGGVNLYKYGN